MRDYSGTSTDATCAGFTAFGGADNEFRAACTNAAGTGASGRSDCADASADAYTFYDQANGDAIDSNGAASGDTITVCYNGTVSTGTGNDCTAASSVVLEGDGANPPGELAADQAVIIEFDVIVQ